MKHHRYTIKELEEKTARELLIMIVKERETHISSEDSPLGLALPKLRRRLEYKGDLDKIMKIFPVGYKAPR